MSQGSAEAEPPPIYVVSGGTGNLGEQLAHTVLAQFPGNRVAVKTVAYVTQRSEIEAVVEQAAADGGTIIHSLVHAGLRRALVTLAEAQDVLAMDLVGDLAQRLTTVLGVPPLGKPGLYRELNLDYFGRVEAIEYTLNHDDGLRPHELKLADVVLTGPSRVGKTPLSIYLSVLGWKTANVPLVPDIPPPTQLFEIERRRVVGLIVEPTTLAALRKKRQTELGAPRRTESYMSTTRIFDEVEAAERVYRKGGFTTLNVTVQPIETTASQVVDLLRRRFGDQVRRR